MANLIDFHQFAADAFNGVHNLGSHTLKAMLTNVVPSLSNTVKSNIAEITAGNGYTAGGATITVTSSTQSGGVYSCLLGADITWTASGGDIGPFQYVVVYNDTPASPLDPLICYVAYPSPITILDGSSFKVLFNGINLIGGTIDAAG